MRLHQTFAGESKKRCTLTITPPWQTFHQLITLSIKSTSYHLFCFINSQITPTDVHQWYKRENQQILKSKLTLFWSVFHYVNIINQNMHSVFCYCRYDGLRMTCAPQTGPKSSWWPQIWPQVILWRQQLTNIITVDQEPLQDDQSNHGWICPNQYIQLG